MVCQENKASRMKDIGGLLKSSNKMILGLIEIDEISHAVCSKSDYF